MSTNTTNELDNQIFAIVQRELTTQRRAIQRLALLAAIVMTGIVTALWITEPQPLPMRLHISFGIMSVIGLTWILILGNILIRKNCPTSWDRIATAWASLAGGIAFAFSSTIITIVRAEPIAAIAFAAIGIVFVTIAAFSLRGAYQWQADLQRRIGEE